MLSFFTLLFHSPLQIFHFLLIKRLFSSSSFSALRVVSSGYLRLLIFLFAVLIPACVSSCPVFLMMYSVYNYTALTYSFSCLEPVCGSMSSSNCCFLTCIQISQEAGPVIWNSHFFQNFPQFVVIHTVKGFGVVNKAEVDIFLELSCFFDDPLDVDNLIFGSSAFSKTSLNIWKFTVHILLKPGLENFEHYFTSM